ncbi:YceI family protein [Chryseobacterium sp.]|uniref:YceI family protein n=1 Tax=Chryseobacterium sp. TaxID=1871047 RepID=UPI0011C73B95|nr:YceI family protein [Chryseobacterium sp.]TXF77652.1 YceI family protein [Chryseobacterium sp.]
MKTLVTGLLLFCLSPLLRSQTNRVEINGRTNINTFKCTNQSFTNSGSQYSLGGTHLPNVILKVEDFDCRNRMMTSDFKKTLNSDRFPNLSIKFIQFNKALYNKYDAVVEVKMMAVTKKYSVEFTSQNSSLVGYKRLKFSDFNITAPKRMGGAVYVKDDLDLVFTLAMED